MAIDPFWGQLISAGISAAGRATEGPQTQLRKSYAGTGADPVKTLMDAINGTKGLGQALSAKARQGVKLRTTVPNMPGFASDPALADPSILERKGLDLGDIFGAPSGPRLPNGPMGPKPPNTDPATGDQEGPGKGGRAGNLVDAAGVGRTASPTTGPDITGFRDVLRFLQDPFLYTNKKKRGSGDSNDPGREDKG